MKTLTESGRAGRCALALAAALTLGSLGATQAMARGMTCRSDPLVVLSNGRIYDLSADITDSASDVKSVNYKLIGPAGTQVVSVLMDSSSLAPREHFSYSATNSAGTYTAMTTVETGTQSRVSAHFYLANNAVQVIGIATVNGWSNSTQQVQFQDSSPTFVEASGSTDVSSVSLPSGVVQPVTQTLWNTILTQLFGQAS